MTGSFRIIVIIFLLISSSCKKQKSAVDNGRELIFQNINVLLDSIEYFDTSEIPISPLSLKDFKINRPVKSKQIKIGILDSVQTKKTDLIEKNNFVEFNISKKELINFKSKYTAEIKKVNDFDTDILFVRFSNFMIDSSSASIIVMKNLGISMTKDKYYFRKNNDKWIFVKKEQLSVG